MKEQVEKSPLQQFRWTGSLESDMKWILESLEITPTFQTENNLHWRIIKKQIFDIDSVIWLYNLLCSEGSDIHVSKNDAIRQPESSEDLSHFEVVVGTLTLFPAAISELENWISITLGDHYDHLWLGEYLDREELIAYVQEGLLNYYNSFMEIRPFKTHNELIVSFIIACLYEEFYKTL